MIDENYTSNFFSNLGFGEFNLDFNLMLIILLILFFIKNLYLVFFNIIQTAFINTVSLRVMNSVYSYYLKQTCEFHLNKNSALLIRNINESGVIDSILLRILTLTNDVLITFGLDYIACFSSTNFYYKRYYFCNFDNLYVQFFH